MYNIFDVLSYFPETWPLKEKAVLPVCAEQKPENNTGLGLQLLPAHVLAMSQTKNK